MFENIVTKLFEMLQKQFQTRDLNPRKKKCKRLLKIKT